MSDSSTPITRRESIQMALGLALLATKASAGAAEALAATAPPPVPPATNPPVRFSEHLVWDRFSYVFGTQAVDLDGDGFLDLSATDTAGFVQTVPFAGEPVPPVPAAKARLYGDPVPPDGPRNSNVYWFRNDGKGNFTRRFLVKDDPQLRLERHTFADLNNDGLPDLVVVDNFYGDVLWYENPGPAATLRGELWKKHYVCKGNMAGAVSIAIADLDGDGWLDVACTGWRMGNCVKWFRNPRGEDREWDMRTIDGGFPVVQEVVAGDIDGDGRPDLVVVSTESRAIIAYRNPGDPTKQPWRREVVDMTPGPKQPAYAKLADLNKDGRLDLVVPMGGFSAGHPGSVVWYENAGMIEGRIDWKKHIISDNMTSATYVDTGDFDGDGWLEVVASGFMPGEIAWFKHPGNPAARWSKYTIKNNWPNVNQLIVADLDHDGRPDIAGVADYGSMELRWWQNLGA